MCCMVYLWFINRAVGALIYKWFRSFESYKMLHTCRKVISPFLVENLLHMLQLLQKLHFNVLWLWKIKATLINKNLKSFKAYFVNSFKTFLKRLGCFILTDMQTKFCLTPPFWMFLNENFKGLLLFTTICYSRLKVFWWITLVLFEILELRYSS